MPRFPCFILADPSACPHRFSRPTVSFPGTSFCSMTVPHSYVSVGFPCQRRFPGVPSRFTDVRPVTLTAPDVPKRSPTLPPVLGVLRQVSRRSPRIDDVGTSFPSFTDEFTSIQAFPRFLHVFPVCPPFPARCRVARCSRFPKVTIVSRRSEPFLSFPRGTAGSQATPRFPNGFTSFQTSPGS